MGGGYGWIGDPTAMRLDEALTGVRRGSSSFVRVEKIFFHTAILRVF